MHVLKNGMVGTRNPMIANEIMRRRRLEAAPVSEIRGAPQRFNNVPAGRSVAFGAGAPPNIGLFQRIANREPIGQPRSISRMLNINIPSGQSLENMGRTGRQFYFGQASALGVPAGEFEDEVAREARGFAPMPRFKRLPRSI